MIYKAAIEQLLETIRRECNFTSGMTGIREFRQKVMDAIAEVPREDFIPSDLQSHAYDNNPLPIGYGQTISQPYIVALMTHLLNPDKNKVILEVGAGSGYQAAILSKLVKKVFTIEIIPALAAKAQKRLARLGYNNVEVLQVDGHMGYPQYAPYDGIIVTAAASFVPSSLMEQLKPGARLVIPVGDPNAIQHLKLIEKKDQGKSVTRDILTVVFVPLTGGG